MALSRYHARRSGDEGLKASWRRAKSLDNFRHKAPQVQEVLFFMDSPDRSKVSMADLKRFLTRDEDGTVESKYNDTRMARNEMKAFASNDLGVQAHLLRLLLLPPELLCLEWLWTCKCCGLLVTIPYIYRRSCYLPVAFISKGVNLSNQYSINIHESFISRGI